MDYHLAGWSAAAQFLEGDLAEKKSVSYYFFLRLYSNYIFSTLNIILILFSFYYFLLGLGTVGIDLTHEKVVVVSEIWEPSNNLLFIFFLFLFLLVNVLNIKFEKVVGG